MFQRAEIKRNYIGAIGMSLVLLLVNSLGLLLGTGIGQITKPTIDNWTNYVEMPTGSGTSADDPYLIDKAEKLAYFAKNGISGTVYLKLFSDIDLEGHLWVPIKSTANSHFYFAGDNHAISNMTINAPTESAGFLSPDSLYIYCNDLTFSNVNIFSGGTTGVIASTMWIGELKNINVVSGKIVSTSSGVGGLIGSVNFATFTNCNINIDIAAKKSVGGIIGWGRGNYNNCYVSGSIKGEDEVGSIIGSASQATINNCYSEAKLYGATNIGGLAGYGYPLNINDSGYNGTIETNEDSVYNVGTIVGGSRLASGTKVINLTNCFGIANIVVKEESLVNAFGSIEDYTNYQSVYSFSKAFTTNGIKEKRKYKTGTNETEPFSGFAYHKNINGGYPFPKTLFAVGQFIDSDVMGYLEEYGFSMFNYPLYKKGDRYYVELGEYPQTYVGDSLNATLKSWYTSNNPSSVDSYTNDKGTSADTITHYAYSYNGNKYVRVVSAILNSSSGYITQDESTTLMPNQEYWFKVEPIKWWVLNYTDVQNGANPIVLAEQALTANVTWNKSTSDQNLWASKSNIRTWLNSTFYNDAFSEVKDDIQTTTVKNNSSSSYTDGSGTSTQDNVWLLSYGEVYGESSTKYSEKQYFNSNKERLCSPTDYALVNNCYMYVNASYPTEIRKNGGSCNWWLRSADASATYFAQYVYGNGYLSNSYVNTYSYAVRPALTLTI